MHLLYFAWRRTADSMPTSDFRMITSTAARTRAHAQVAQRKVPRALTDPEFVRQGFSNACAHPTPHGST